MTLRGCLALGRKRLEEGGVAEAELESRLLLRHATGLDEAGLILHYDGEPESGQEKTYRRLIERRLYGEPSAYILGEREFFGMVFSVNPDVLIPRPETELLVERVIALGKGYLRPHIADIGTGSGALAVSLAIHLPQATIIATDYSEPALRTARMNAERHGVEGRVIFKQGDLLDVLAEPVDILIANLPYVPTGQVASSTHEPRLALDGGPKGISVIEHFCRGLAGRVASGGSVLLEVGQGQAEVVADILSASLPSARILFFNDLAGIPRVVQATLAERLGA